MEDVGEEIETEGCIVGRIVKRRMKWTGQMVRVKDEKDCRREPRQRNKAVSENEEGHG